MSNISLRLPLSLIAIMLSIRLIAATGWERNIPTLSPVVNGYEDTETVKSRLAAIPLHHIEGIWRLGSDQAIVAIERCTDPSIVAPGVTIYQIAIVDSPRCSIAPGTILGYTVPTGRPETYDARLYTSTARSLLRQHARFTLRLDSDDTHLSITPVKSGWKLLMRNTFHFLVRIGIYHDPQADTDINGFTRLYPHSTGRPDQPVYL